MAKEELLTIEGVVDEILPDGRFGAAEETGREMNAAISEGARDGLGMGEALGRRLEKLARRALAPWLGKRPPSAERQRATITPLKIYR